jgi:hypothetical protein
MQTVANVEVNETPEAGSGGFRKRRRDYSDLVLEGGGHYGFIFGITNAFLSAAFSKR